MASSDDESISTQQVRASGRVRRKPETLYDQDATLGDKRRLGGGSDDEDDDDEDDSDSSEEEPDDEELREQRAKQRKQRSKIAKQPPQKKQRTNGTTNLVFRTSRPRAKGTTLSTLDAGNAGGIFAEVFAQNRDAQEIVAQWLTRFEEHEARALAEIVNFVLRAAGCTSTVSEENMEDPDNITSVITELQDEFQATDPTEYPLVKKGKTATTVKQGVTSLLDALVKSIAQTGALFDEPILMENIQAWFSTMSTAANRPFRHTATIVSLITMTALAEVARDVASDAAKSQRQAETEGKKATKNKARVQEIQKKAQQAAERQTAAEALLMDWYGTVFVHRYKDVDAAVRRECAAALGQWIITLPSTFLDGTHLRYLGWTLSDAVASVRLEAVRQLLRLYSNPEMVNGLKSFTEKYRSRLVEMVTSDADAQVRITAISLLEQLRDNGMLTPADIDAIGKLIFESDSRIRTATAKFLAEGIKELRDMRVDQLGGQDNLVTALPESGPDVYDAPRVEWLVLKCLAEILQAYHTEDDLPNSVQRSRDHGGLVLQSGKAESRFSLAAEALYDQVEEVHEWRLIAGFLLFDATTSRKKRSSLDTLARFRNDCALTSSEEIILLDVLRVSLTKATTSILEEASSGKIKLSKQEKNDLLTDIEESARDLLIVLPKLLERFGDKPETASVVMQMQRVLKGEVVSGLGLESRAYESLLEKDKRQFLSHVTNDIPETAAQAMLQAKLIGNNELASDKMTSAYDASVASLVESLDLDSLETRGSASNNTLREVRDNLVRLIELAKVSDPRPPLERPITTTTKKDKIPSTAIDCVISLVSRGRVNDARDVDSITADLEDEVVILAGELALFYARWRFHAIKEQVEGPQGTDMPDDELEALAVRRDRFAHLLTSVLEERRPRDELFSRLAELQIDLHIASAMLVNVNRGVNAGDDYTVFVIDLDSNIQQLIMRAFAGAEAVYANLAKKKIGQQDEDGVTRFDDDPVSDSEDEDESSEAAQLPRSEAKLKAMLLAERRLCSLTSKIIMSVMVGHMERRTTQARVERNKNLLGANFKAICEYFNHGQPTTKKAKKAKQGRRASAETGKKSRKSHAFVAESENEDEIEDEAIEVNGGADVDMEA